MSKCVGLPLVLGWALKVWALPAVRWPAGAGHTPRHPPRWLPLWLAPLRSPPALIAAPAAPAVLPLAGTLTPTTIIWPLSWTPRLVSEPTNPLGRGSPASLRGARGRARTAWLHRRQASLQRSLCSRPGPPSPLLTRPARSPLPYPPSCLAEPRPDWSPLLDRVRRGQEAVGAARAVPIVVGESPCSAGCLLARAASASLCDAQGFLRQLSPAQLRSRRRGTGAAPQARWPPPPPAPALPPPHPQGPTRWWAWPAAPLTEPPWWLAWCPPTACCCASWRRWACRRCRCVPARRPGGLVWPRAGASRRACHARQGAGGQRACCAVLRRTLLLLLGWLGVGGVLDPKPMLPARARTELAH